MIDHVTPPSLRFCFARNDGAAAVVLDVFGQRNGAGAGKEPPSSVAAPEFAEMAEGCDSEGEGGRGAERRTWNVERIEGNGSPVPATGSPPSVGSRVGASCGGMQTGRRRARRIRGARDTPRRDSSSYLSLLPRTEDPVRSPLLLPDGTPAPRPWGGSPSFSLAVQSLAKEWIIGNWFVGTFVTCLR